MRLLHVNLIISIHKINYFILIVTQFTKTLMSLYLVQWILPISVQRFM